MVRRHGLICVWAAMETVMLTMITPLTSGYTLHPSGHNLTVLLQTCLLVQAIALQQQALLSYAATLCRNASQQVHDNMHAGGHLPASKCPCGDNIPACHVTLMHPQTHACMHARMPAHVYTHQIISKCSKLKLAWVCRVLAIHHPRPKCVSMHVC